LIQTLGILAEGHEHSGLVITGHTDKNVQKLAKLSVKTDKVPFQGRT